MESGLNDGICVPILFVFLAPLLVFSPRLIRLRVKEVRRYSALSGDVARRFDSRWVEPDNDGEDIDRLLVSSEVDTLANLNVTFDTVKRIRIVPVDLVTALTIAGATLGPMLPLVLTVYTPGEILAVVRSILM